MAAQPFDTKKVDVSCASCGNKTRRTLGELRRDPTIECQMCGSRTQVDVSKFEAGAADGDTSLDQFFKKR
jgi:hypothetical protein